MLLLVARLAVAAGALHDRAYLEVVGAEATEYLGAWIDGAGDVDADGYADLVVGSVGWDDYRGAARLYRGGAGGLGADPLVSWTGTAAAEQLGEKVAGVGDVDDDGFDDVLLASYPTDAAWVHLGGPAGPDGTPDAVLAGEPGSWFGSALAGRGDLDGDGFGDAAVGAYRSASYAGLVAVYLGGEGGLTAEPTTFGPRAVGEAMFGYNLTIPGDVDADGYDDLVVSSLGEDNFAGAVYLYVGGADGPRPPDVAAFRGDGEFAQVGRGLFPVGDLDGDGHADLGLSKGWARAAGEFWVVGGAPSGLEDAPRGIATDDTRCGPAFGYQARLLGDLDGNGLEELAVGCVDAAGPGAVVTFESDGSAFTGPVRSAVSGGAGPDGFGAALGVGDFDADGAPDLAVGAPESASFAGAFGVFRGDGDADGDAVASALDCDDADAVVGYGVDGFEDADGDGYGATPLRACAGSPGWATAAGDCDDAAEGVHPGADEACDGRDDDCDGVADEDAVDARTCALDADGDGYGDGTAVTACACPDGTAEGLPAGDCAPTDATIHPGATDVPGDGRDADCDGADPELVEVAPDPEREGCGCGTGGGAPGVATILVTLLAARRRGALVSPAA